MGSDFTLLSRAALTVHTIQSYSVPVLVSQFFQECAWVECMFRKYPTEPVDFFGKVIHKLIVQGLVISCCKILFLYCAVLKWLKVIGFFTGGDDMGQLNQE